MPPLPSNGKARERGRGGPTTLKHETPYACREKKKGKTSYLEFDHIENWHKGFCVNDGGVVCQTSEDGRLHVVTGAIHDLTSKFKGGIQFCNKGFFSKGVTDTQHIYQNTAFQLCLRALDAVKSATPYLSTTNQSTTLLLGLFYGCQVLVHSLLGMQGTIQCNSC